MKKSLVPLLAVLVLLLGGLSYYEWAAAGTAAGALSAATKDRDALRRRIADLEKRAQTLQDEASDLREQARAVRAAPPASAGPRQMSFRTGGPGGMPGPMLALESPEMRRLMAVGQRGQLDSRYAALFKSLGLPPAQLDKFKQLLFDKQNAALDVMAAARSQGLMGPDSHGQIQSLVQQANREVDDSIKGLLGDAAFQQFQQFDRTQPQRAIVDQLASRLSYTAAPLSAQQSEQLVQLLADTAPAGSSAGGDNAAFNSGVRVATFVGPGGPGGATGTAILNVVGGGANATITPEAVTRAQGILNPPQLEALQQIQAEQQAQQQMGQLMHQSIESQGGAGRIVPGPPGG